MSTIRAQSNPDSGGTAMINKWYVLETKDECTPFSKHAWEKSADWELLICQECKLGWVPFRQIVRWIMGESQGSDRKER